MPGPINTTALGELLKQLYASWEIEQQVNLTHPVLAECAREGSAQLGGSGFFYPVRLAAAESHAYITEDQVIPDTADGSNVQQASVSPVIHAGTVVLSGLSMAVSSGDTMAFARAFEENVSQTIDSMSAYKEGTLFRDGSGILGTAAGAPSTVTLTLNEAPAYIREGMYLAVKDSGAGTTWHNGGGAGATSLRVKVSNVNWAAQTIVCTAAVSGTNDIWDSGIGAADEIYIAGSQLEDAADASNREPVGLSASVAATGSYNGIDRDSDVNGANWRGNVIAVGGFLDESELLRGRTRITQETGIQLQTISSSFKAVTHPVQVDVLFKLALPRIRYSGNEKFDLGNSQEVCFGNIPFMTSYNCPVDEAYLGDWMYHKSLYTPNGKLHIDTQYNGSALKWVANFDRGLVFLKEYHNFAHTRPNAFVRYTGLSTPTL